MIVTMSEMMILFDSDWSDSDSELKVKLGVIN